jgi:hypothetical protein
MNENLSPIQKDDIKVDREIVLVVSEENGDFIFEGTSCGHELLVIAEELISLAREKLVHRAENDEKE